MVNKRAVAIFPVLISLAVLVSGSLRYSGIEHGLYDINSTVMDGLLVWSADKFIIIGLAPIIIISVNSFLKKYEYSSFVSFRYHRRLNIWFQQELRILKMCLAAMLLSMILSGIYVLVINGGKINILYEIHDFDADSYMGRYIAAYGVSDDYNINYLQVLFQCFLINSLEMFLLSTMANAIEWITMSTFVSVVISYSVSIVLGINPQAGYAYDVSFFYIKVLPGDYYLELLNLNIYYKRLLTIITVIVILNVLACFFVSRRDFIKRGDLH